MSGGVEKAPNPSLAQDAALTSALRTQEKKDKGSRRTESEELQQKEGMRKEVCWGGSDA